MPGEIVHIELPSRDFERSATFYGKLFGWRTDGAQAGGHLLFEVPGGTQGSWIREALAEAPGPIPFVAVDDIDETLAEAERQGGRVLVRRLSLGARGQFGLLSDLDGNVIAVLSTGAPAAAKKPAAIAKPAAAKPAAAKPAASKPAGAVKTRAPARKR